MGNWAVRELAAAKSALGEDALLTATKTIAFAAVRTLHATPVELIAIPADATKYIEIVSVHAMLVYGTAGYDSVAATDYLELRYTDANGSLLVGDITPASFGDATADDHMVLVPGARSLPKNANVVAYIAGTEWYAAAGDSALKFNVKYRLRTLAL